MVPRVLWTTVESQRTGRKEGLYPARVSSATVGTQTYKSCTPNDISAGVGLFHVRVTVSKRIETPRIINP